MNSFIEQFGKPLSERLQAVVSQLLLTASGDDRDWEAALSALRRHGLLETLVPAPFTRLGFSREAIKVDRQRLGDPAHRQDVSARIAAELVHLVKREIDDVSGHVLLGITAENLLDSLSRLYVNQSTGRGIARHILSGIVVPVVANSEGVNAVMQSLDRRLEVVDRVLQRRLDRVSRELEARTQARYEEAKAHIEFVGEIVTRAQEAEHCCLSEARPYEALCRHHVGKGPLTTRVEQMVEQHCREYISRDERS